MQVAMQELKSAVHAAHQAAQQSVTQYGLEHPVSQELVGHWRVLKFQYEDAAQGASCAS